MNKVTDITALLPEMKTGMDLQNALQILPPYNEKIKNESAAIRLMALSELYNVYVPSAMSIEIYNKLYLALIRSLQKKGTHIAIQQQYENFRHIRQYEYNSIMGGADSFTIIGTSGIGKSSAINRAISLICEERIIEIDEPYTKIVLCVVVQCPFDASVKGLVLEILRKVDECLDTKYYVNAVKARATTDMLIGSVSQIALNHIGLLVVDEIQNVCNNKNGKHLVGMLTQLINNSGISICMVGTPECKQFFEQRMQLARRSLGLQYSEMPYNAEFKRLCEIIFEYQYLKNKAAVSDAMIEWLYEHSAGIVSVVVSLLHDAQEIAILQGGETLNMKILNMAYQQRIELLHEYIHPAIIHTQQTSKPKKKATAANLDLRDIQEMDENISIEELAAEAKSTNKDILAILKEHITIVEVAV